MTAEKLLTIGLIAERLAEPVHRIRYVIATRQIEPTAKAGNARVFDQDSVESIRKYLTQIAVRKGGPQA